MKLSERVKFIRNNLGMNQAKFGEILGVTRSEIKNTELNNLKQPEKKIPLLKLMCKEFNISEDWLINGNGTPSLQETNQDDNFNIQEFAKELGATNLEIEILKAYFDMDKSLRKEVINHFVSYLTDDTHSKAKEFINDFKTENKCDDENC